MDTQASGLKECDIVMKGGLTSGVVYSPAILRLAKHYRFRNIGGTSAGAIAAVVTAAAEYNRDGGGYKVVEGMPAEARVKLQSLFQAAPAVRAIFEAGNLASQRQWGAFARHVVAAFWPYLLVLFGVPLVLALLAGNPVAAVLLFLCALVTTTVALAAWLVLSLLRKLKELDFGFCPGPTQRGYREAAVAEWLADKIETSAGRMQEGGPHPATPLTFGDLWKGGPVGKGIADAPAIDLRMMTTNVSLRRPYTLPITDRNHYFREDEFRRVLPGWIVDYLVGLSPPDARGFCQFPEPARLPIVVAARMSLSFPVLFSAVPLYRVDFPHADETKGLPAPMQRMLFSDGGISSNFPIHFFDALLPGRPTFGISLGDFDEPDGERVRLPKEAGSHIWLDSTGTRGLGAFLLGIVYAAKDWQDRLQSTLPGYRERIATVYLKESEGGLNLGMTPEMIDQLVEYGDRAGALLANDPVVDQSGTPQFPDDRTPFDFDEHRWRRYLVAFARLEETLQVAAKAWGERSDAGSFSAFIARYMGTPKSYKSPPWWREAAFGRFDAMMKVAAAWNGKALRFEEGAISRPDTNMRITPKP